MIPAMRFFTLALRFEVALHYHGQLTDRHSFKNAHRETGGRSDSCPVGLAFVVITIVVVVIAGLIPIMLTVNSHEA